MYALYFHACPCPRAHSPIILPINLTICDYRFTYYYTPLLFILQQSTYKYPSSIPLQQTPFSGHLFQLHI